MDNDETYYLWAMRQVILYTRNNCMYLIDSLWSLVACITFV